MSALDAASIRPGSDGVKVGYMLTIRAERDRVLITSAEGFGFN
jgi:hypothetical protein